MDAALPTLLFFDPERAARREARRRAEDAARREERLFCAQCRRPVTHRRERIEVAGAHEHSFTNPHGVVYRIGCFREAATSAIGMATTEFTWFRGYAWRVALCPGCQTHLGWRYDNDHDHFHGLIVGRLSAGGAG